MTNQEQARPRPSLHEFVRDAWPIVETDAPFIDNWHIQAICQHLEYATRTRNYALLINIPPGCMKSLLTCVFWPAWVWGPHGWPAARWLFASYGQDLSTRDSQRCRAILASPWYQERWDVRLADDANLKTYYRNTAHGWRLATSFGGRGTGEHPDFIVADDPHSADDAESDVERQSQLDWWDGTISTRGRIRGARKVVIMQRLHIEDLSAKIIEAGTWDHICLPMRFEPDRMQPSKIGWTDPRESDGELLWPAAFPDALVTSIEKELGSRRSAGQLQQRPVPLGGDFFRREWFNQLVGSAPTGSNCKAVRYWDKAGSLDGDYTAGVLIVERHGEYYVVDVVRGKWTMNERERIILATAKLDHQWYPRCQIWIEQEPGSGGADSASYTIKNLAGYSIKADKVGARKEIRWEPWAAQLEAGNVHLVEGPWNREFIDEHLVAPNGTHDDQIDAASGAFSKVALGKNVDLAKWLQAM